MPEPQEKDRARVILGSAASSSYLAASGIFRYSSYYRPYFPILDCWQEPKVCRRTCELSLIGRVLICVSIAESGFHEAHCFTWTSLKETSLSTDRARLSSPNVLHMSVPFVMPKLCLRTLSTRSLNLPPDTMNVANVWRKRRTPNDVVVPYPRSWTTMRLMRRMYTDTHKVKKLRLRPPLSFVTIDQRLSDNAVKIRP